MGPVCTNYGTFIIPSECGQVQAWRDEEVESELQTKNYQNNPCMTFLDETPSAAAVDFRLRRKEDGSFGVRLGTDRGEVVLLQVDEDIARIRGLREGDVVSHVDGRPLLGSLRTAITRVKDVKDTIQLRIQTSSEDSYATTSRGHSRRKYHVVQHLVRQGDSIEGLAAQHGTTPEQIRSDNRRHFPVGETGFLCPGQTLMLRASLIASDGTVPGDEGDHRQRNCKGRLSPGTGRIEGTRKQILYEVQEGDSLESICSRLGAQEAEVRRCNRRVFPVGEAGTLTPGKLLTVFATECHSSAAEEARECLGKEYVVRGSLRFGGRREGVFG